MTGMLRRAALRQARTLVSLWWWVHRHRHGVGPTGRALGYARERTPMLIALAGLLGVETAVVGLLVPWPVVHVLDALAVLQILGIAAVEVTRPHYVRDGLLVLREGPLFEARVPVAAIASVRVERKYHDGPTLQLTDGPVAALNVVIGKRTDVRVELSEPVTVVRPDGTTGEVELLRFHADEPAAAVAAIRDACRFRSTPIDVR